MNSDDAIADFVDVLASSPELIRRLEEVSDDAFPTACQEIAQSLGLPIRSEQIEIVLRERFIRWNQREIL